MEKKNNIKIISNNKKASFNYFLSDFLEVGIELTGTEIKSIRLNKCNINDAFIIIKNRQVYIINMNIPIYEKGTIYNHNPKRDRRLLMHKYQINKYASKVEEKGYTLLPIKVYLSNGRAKLEIALGKGKKLFDKRDSIKERDINRDINRSIKEKNNEK